MPHGLRLLRSLVCGLLVALSLTPSVRAAEPEGGAGPPAPPGCRDHEVTLPLAVEAWVATTTARVRVALQAAADPETGRSIRDRILPLLRQLLPEGQPPDGVWHLTTTHLGRDPAGLERWSLQAEIRAPEAQLPGLHERARSLSKPGLSLTVSIDWTPSLADVEAAKAQARAALYTLAKEEAERLNTRLGASYRVGDLTVVEPGRPGPPLRARLKEQALPEVSAEALPRADRLTLEALVVLRERACPGAALSREPQLPLSTPESPERRRTR